MDFGQNFGKFRKISILVKFSRNLDFGQIFEKFRFRWNIRKNFDFRQNIQKFRKNFDFDLIFRKISIFLENFEKFGF